LLTISLSRLPRPPSSSLFPYTTLFRSAALVSFGNALLEDDDRSDAHAFVHQIEGLVDVFQGEGVGDHRVDLDLAVHVPVDDLGRDRKSTRLNSSHVKISYAVFCLKKKK